VKRLLVLMLLAAAGNSAVRAAPKTLTPQQVIEAKADVLGEAALHHSAFPTDGALPQPQSGNC
jgi:hypothetical protein